MQNTVIKQDCGIQVNPLIASIREAEVKALRERVAELEGALFSAREETAQFREKTLLLETYLYLLAQAVLAGEEEKAQDYAQLSRKLIDTL